MDIQLIERNVRDLIENKLDDKEEFIFGFLRVYGSPQATITRLKKGGLNLSKEQGEVFLKKKIFFKIKSDQDEDIHLLIDGLKKSHNISKNFPRFLMVTDFETLLSIDTNNNQGLDIKIKELPKHFDFFLPLCGREKVQIQNEGVADRKAAEKLAKLYDLITEDQGNRELRQHHINIFLSRLLFCLFAEDTGLFEENYFTNSIKSHTQEEGNDLSSTLR